MCSASHLVGLRCVNTLESNFWESWLFAVCFKPFCLFHPFQSCLCSLLPCLLFCIAGLGLHMVLCVWSCSSLTDCHTWHGSSLNTHVWPNDIRPMRAPYQLSTLQTLCPAIVLYVYPLALLLHLPQHSRDTVLRAVLTSLPLHVPVCIFGTTRSSFLLIKLTFILNILQDWKSVLSFSCFLLSLQFLTLSSVLPTL